MPVEKADSYQRDTQACADYGQYVIGKKRAIESTGPHVTAAGGRAWEKQSGIN